MSKKYKALLLNMLVLPGLGQLYVGRRNVGLSILALVNLLLLLGLFVLLRGSSPLIAAKMTTGSIGASDIASAMESVSGFGRALLGGFALLWSFAVVDILRYREQP